MTKPYSQKNVSMSRPAMFWNEVDSSQAGTVLTSTTHNQVPNGTPGVEEIGTRVPGLFSARTEGKAVENSAYSILCSLESVTHNNTCHWARTLWCIMERRKLESFSPSFCNLRVYSLYFFTLNLQVKSTDFDVTLFEFTLWLHHIPAGWP